MAKPKQDSDEGKGNWVTCSVRRFIKEQVENFVALRRDPTITNWTQFVDLAIREKLVRDGHDGTKGGGSK